MRWASGSRASAVLAALLLCAGQAAAGPPPAAPQEFVVLQDIAPSILDDIPYITPHNFTGDPVDGYWEPLCILTRPAAEALSRAQQDFLEDGYSLKVYDCYRPQRAVDDFVGWAENLADQRMKAEFYPRVDKSVLFADGYIAERSGHSRGSTLDVTLVPLAAAAGAAPSRLPSRPLVDCAALQALRFPDDSIDMGTGFDCFDTLANTADPRVGGDQAKNRLLLVEGLQRQGFVNYDKEWWHFTYAPAGIGEPYPDTYFDFPVERAALAPG